MRHILLLSISTALLGQIYVYDVDGRRVLLPSPVEKRTRTVVEDTPGSKVFEDIIERRDVNGNRLPPEKIRIVEKQTPGGEKTVETTVYQSDLNGHLGATERSIVTVQLQGAQTTTTAIVERPTVNGSFAAVEKTASETRKEGAKELTNRATYVLDQNGSFIEAVRESIEKTTEGKGFKEVALEYRNAPTGKMELTGQRVKVETSNADGSTTSEVSIYGTVAQGRTVDGQLKLREQQLVTTKPGPGNTQVESIRIRRPDLADSKLGAYEKVGEKITQLPPKP